ncbi:hypothetical protein AGR8A_Lc10304 [Agrobacterium fabrum str. J-07]|nr:hypothetical protein AGR8A_Lc10304 [Agrobacterium fabrum str. J-07]
MRPFKKRTVMFATEDHIDAQLTKSALG